MNKEEFHKIAFDKALVIDGAIGTMLQSFGFNTAVALEAAVLEKPDLLGKIHRAYIEAGADIILTDTFGGSPLRLKEYGLDNKTQEINRLAVEIAHRAAEGKVLVAASIGPSGAFLEPIGRMTFEEAYDNFRLQADALVSARPDLFILETFSDIREIKAAVIAIKDALVSAGSDTPIIAQMTFTEDCRSVTGTDPVTFVVVMEALGMDGIGVNCSVGPAQMLPVVRELCKATHLPVSVEPNAGIPELVGGRTVFRLKPEEFGEYIKPFLEAGASLVGSCCGTTPEFTKVIADNIKGWRPKPRKEHNYLRLASRTKTISFSPSEPIRIIGERINPAGRKALKSELLEGKMDLVRSEAAAQEKAGSAALDVNVSVFKADDRELLPKAVRTVQASSSLPLVLDNSNPETLELALKEIEGKAMINSTSGEEEKMKCILDLAVRYGAAVVGIALDEDGIPDTSDGRLRVAKKIKEAAERSGLPKKDLVLDALVLSVSTGAEKTAVTLEILRRIKKELRCQTILGVSNVSYGLPERSAANSTFLAIALEHGLDLPIADPLDESIRNVIYSFNLLKGLDPGGKNYIAEMASRGGGAADKAAGIGQAPAVKKSETAELKPLDRIKKMIIEGDKDSIAAVVEAATGDGEKPLDIVNNALVPAMVEVGRLFNNKLYFLPQVLLSAETMKAAFSVIKSRLGDSEESSRKGTIVFATVKGDVHDLGKNIVITLLESYGFKVIDLGKSVLAETIVDAAVSHKASCIALSALMTTTMGEMKNVIELARGRRIALPFIIGGAVVTKSYADEIGAHYGKDAVEAVEVVSGITGIK